MISLSDPIIALFATSVAHSVSRLPGQSCRSHPRSSRACTNIPSNNVVASSVSTLDLSESDSRSLLSSPQTYLNKQSATEAANIRSVLIPAYKKGFRIIFIVGAALAALAFFMAVWLMPQVGLKRDDDAALKEEGKKRVEGKLDEEKRAVNEERRAES